MFGSRSRPEALICLALFLGLAMLFPGFSFAGDETSDLSLLGSWMTGDFSSAAQAAEDPEFFDINLHLAPIWLDRSDCRWFYVEQALYGHQDHPYRQRVYCVLEIAPGLFEIRTFTLPNPTAVVGAWLAENPIADLEPGDLAQRDGCSILLRRRGESFVGSTLASLCASSLRGASYATSEVVVTPDGMVSWDRGFADDGVQVWGAVKGGYVFDRIVDDPDVDLEPEPVAESASESTTAPAHPPAPNSDSASDSDSDSDSDSEENVIRPASALEDR